MIRKRRDSEVGREIFDVMKKTKDSEIERKRMCWGQESIQKLREEDITRIERESEVGRESVYMLNERSNKGRKGFGSRKKELI